MGDDILQFSSDDEELYYALTLLIHAVNPAIDQGATYELIAELFGNGFETDDRIVECGERIRATAFARPVMSKH